MAQTLPSVLGSAALLFSGSPEGGADGFQLSPNREGGVKTSSNGRTQSTFLPLLKCLTD